MIVLRRRPGDSFWIGDEVRVEVLGLSPSRVKLGIVAPGEVIVQRSEVRAAQEQNRVAAQSRLPVDLRRFAEALRGIPPHF